jgi:GT2 family glycosyltransferase
LPIPPPFVSLIIPTRNGVDLVRQCIESIVLETAYPHYEILLIDNGSDDPEALAYFEQLHAQPNITVIRDDRPFNYSALNNAAVASAHGDIIGLLNNDIEVMGGDWLDEMVSIALQPGVGAVGAKLLYPDLTVQHGGILLGVGGVAGHSHKHLPATAPGHGGRAQLLQSFSAVTAACLVVRKALYDEVGGLDEEHLGVAYNDVDFCLRLREAGYRSVWTPYPELLHHESASRGLDLSTESRDRLTRESAWMRQRWGALIANDPAYNPNLTLEFEDFGLAWPPRGADARGKIPHS